MNVAACRELAVNESFQVCPWSLSLPSPLSKCCWKDIQSTHCALMYIFLAHFIDLKCMKFAQTNNLWKYMSDITDVTPEVCFLNCGLGLNMVYWPVVSRNMNGYDCYYFLWREYRAKLKWHILGLKVETYNNLQIKTIRIGLLKLNSKESKSILSQMIKEHWNKLFRAGVRRNVLFIVVVRQPITRKTDGDSVSQHA